MAEAAYQTIRDRVVAGDWPAGAQLVNRKLGTELGVSMVPVREALNRLASEGLVEKVIGRPSRSEHNNRSLIAAARERLALLTLVT